jgi:hypothetical protein
MAGNDFEKELAVLKGRIDGLEAKVGEFEASQGRAFNGGVLMIDCYNLTTREMKKSAKVIQTTARFNRWNRISGDNSALWVSHDSAVILENSNESGDYPLIGVRTFGDTSLSGKDLVIGGSNFDGDNFYNFGTVPSPEGSYMIINRQRVY